MSGDGEAGPGQRRIRRRVLGRRALFFWVTTVVCLALVPAMPSEFRWVAWATAGLGAVWALLLSVEDLQTPGEPREARFPPVVAEAPFGPPPPPGGPRD